MLEYYEIMKRVLDVKTNKTICVIETFPLITENVPSDKSIFINSCDTFFTKNSKLSAR